MTPELPDLLLILAGTFAVSILTLLTGFGLGTILTPVFLVVYDIKTAVFLVAVAHLANNLLKVGLFARRIDWKILRRFGLVSIGGALLGSLLQGALSAQVVTAVLGVFLIAMGVNEFLPKSAVVRLPTRFDVLGGFFSGFLGGLIGNQGAIRSAYLLNYSVSKEAFIATAAMIATLIDVTRIPVYVTQHAGEFGENALMLGLVILAAFAGTLIGNSALKKLSLQQFRFVVSAFLVIAGIGLLF